MKTIALKKVTIGRKALVTFPIVIQKLLDKIEDELMAAYAEEMRFAWEDLSPMSIEIEKTKYLEQLEYAVITYPKDVPLLFSNDRNGGFDYAYRYTFLTEHTVNARIQAEIRIDRTPSSYLVEKIDSSEASYLFFHEMVDSDGTRRDKIVVVIC